MTTPEPEVAAWLPSADVRSNAGVAEGGPSDNLRLERIRQGVAEFVQDNRADLWFPAANDPDRVFAPTARVVEAALLMVSRLIARKSTPLGTQNYGEFAAAILRSDPDIGLMLGIGRNSKPALG
jgi:hypothetical protein